MASSPARVARRLSLQFDRVAREMMTYKVASLAIADAALSMGVTVRAILSNRRTPKVCRARCLAWWLMQECTCLSNKSIAESTGFDHSSVRYGIRRFDAELNAGEPWAIEALGRLGNTQKRAA